MQAFRLHTGIAAPLGRDNVDTDQIIPKQFLKRIQRTGFGQFLFYDWRFDENGRPRPEFVLNHPRYADASVLLAGKNFGCGSSREHAPWALQDYGFRAVVAPSFADIFANNCVKNGLLTVTLPEMAISEFMRRAEANDGYRVTVDLERCVVRDSMGASCSFTIDAFKRDCLLRGLDDIGLTLMHEDAIAAYEAKPRPFGRIAEGV